MLKSRCGIYLCHLNKTLFDIRQNAQKTTPNVLIASCLDEAPRPTQLAVLDMMRCRQTMIHEYKGTKVQPFLVVALLTDGYHCGPLLTPHLVSLLPILRHLLIDHNEILIIMQNDYFFILHDVASQDFPTNPQRPGLEPTLSSASLASFSSVIVNRPIGTIARDTRPLYRPVIRHDTIITLQALAAKIHSTPEIRRYTHNIVTFLRLHRGVAGGVSALSSRHLVLLAQ